MKTRPSKEQLATAQVQDNIIQDFVRENSKTFLFDLAVKFFSFRLNYQGRFHDTVNEIGSIICQAIEKIKRTNYFPELDLILPLNNLLKQYNQNRLFRYKPKFRVENSSIINFLESAVQVNAHDPLQYRDQYYAYLNRPGFRSALLFRDDMIALGANVEFPGKAVINFSNDQDASQLRLFLEESLFHISKSSDAMRINKLCQLFFMHSHKLGVVSILETYFDKYLEKTLGESDSDLYAATKQKLDAKNRQLVFKFYPAENGYIITSTASYFENGDNTKPCLLELSATHQISLAPGIRDIKHYSLDCLELNCVVAPCLPDVNKQTQAQNERINQFLQRFSQDIATKAEVVKQNANSAKSGRNSAKCFEPVSIEMKEMSLLSPSASTSTRILRSSSALYGSQTKNGSQSSSKQKNPHSSGKKRKLSRADDYTDDQHARFDSLVVESAGSARKTPRKTPGKF